MHKLRVNQLVLDVVIKPNGPILIKSGLDSAADPTLPQMNFVRTQHPNGGETIYLPGSSLKGVIRSHAERILRTVYNGSRQKCCDPVGSDCAKPLQKVENSAEIYRRSCLACRIFGSTALGSHFFINDAFPGSAISNLERRHNVVIDRRNGSSRNTFDMEVAVTGEFTTRLYLHNYELWQIGLLGLTLRDIDTGHVRVGFGKSRGLGAVHVNTQKAVIHYTSFGSSERDFGAVLFGVGDFVSGPTGADGQKANSYGLLTEDRQPFSAGTLDDAGWGRVELQVQAQDAVEKLFKAGVAAWSHYIPAAGVSA